MTSVISISVEPFIGEKKHSRCHLHGSIVVYTNKPNKYVHDANKIPIKITYTDFVMKIYVDLFYIIKNIPMQEIINALPNVTICNNDVFLETFDNYVTVKTTKEFYTEYLSKSYDAFNSDNSNNY